MSKASEAQRIAALERALRACVKAIEEELNAAGDDDHPAIKRHARVAERARALLAAPRSVP